jgi:hypothetical protein
MIFETFVYEACDWCKDHLEFAGRFQCQLNGLFRFCGWIDERVSLWALEMSVYH